MTSTLDTNPTHDTIRDGSALTAAHTGFTVSNEDYANDWQSARDRSHGRQNQNVNNLPALVLVASLDENTKPCGSKPQNSSIDLECLADLRRESSSEINRFEREHGRLKAEQTKEAVEANNKRIDDTATRTIEKVLQELPENLTKSAINGDKAVGVYAVYEDPYSPRMLSRAEMNRHSTDPGYPRGGVYDAEPHFTASELMYHPEWVKAETERRNSRNGGFNQPTFNEQMADPANRADTDSILPRLRKPEIELFETLKKRGLKPYFAHSNRTYMAVELP